MPDGTINHTTHGVPYLDQDNWISIYPAYTEELAELIDQLGSPTEALLAILADAIAARDAAQAVIADTGWNTLSFSSPTGTATYRRRGNQVEVRFETTATVAAGTLVSPLFTLPTGYRPTTLVVLAAAGGGGDRSAGAAIDPAGNVRIRNNYTAAVTVMGAGTFYTD